MPVHRLADLVAFVRERSPFYRELYAQLPARVDDVRRLPVVEQKLYWEANDFARNRLLTGPMSDGIFFKTGGTTGAAKFSVYSKEEWRDLVTRFGAGLTAGGLLPGERVGNLFYAGELYGSMLLMTRAMDEATVGVLQFPIAGSTAISEMVAIIHTYGLNALLGTASTLLLVADHIRARFPDRSGFRLRRLLFAGEAMHDDQRRSLTDLFPEARVQSVGYAAIDSGLLGYADTGCGPGEHRCFSDSTLFEILDPDTGEPIDEEGRPGTVVTTDLVRTLMPVIRYPVGDRAAWVEPPGPHRKFTLLGRTGETARVGPVALRMETVERALREVWEELQLSNFQMVIVHHDQRDQLILRLAASASPAQLEAASARVIAAIAGEQPLYQEMVDAGRLHQIRLEQVALGDLAVNPRTGKLRRLLDQRFDQ